MKARVLVWEVWMGPEPILKERGGGSWSTDLEDWPSDTHHPPTPQISPDYQEKQRVAQG